MNEGKRIYKMKELLITFLVALMVMQTQAKWVVEEGQLVEVSEDDLREAVDREEFLNKQALEEEDRVRRESVQNLVVDEAEREPVRTEMTIKDQVNADEVREKIQKELGNEVSKMVNLDTTIGQLKKNEPQLTSIETPLEQEVSELPKFDQRFKTIKRKSVNVPKCDKDVLSMIGIKQSQESAIPATFAIRGFCYRNQYSCCSAKEIKSLQATFKEQAHLYNQEADVIEELLTLFRGPKFFEFAKDFYENGDGDMAKCKSKATDINPDYWNSENQGLWMEELRSLLLDFERYTKRNVYWAANTVCTLCNPFNHRFFQSSSKTLQGNEATCREMLEEKDYELRLAKLFHYFLRPTALVMNCVKYEEYRKSPSEVAQKEAEKDKKADKEGDNAGETRVEAINMEKVEELLADFEFCYMKVDSEPERCKSLCNRKMATYQFVVPFFRQARQALKAVFEYFLDDDSIDDYYEEVKKDEFPLDRKDIIVEFFKKADESSLSVADFSWQFNPSGGVTIMTDHMHKRFYKITTA